MSPDVMLECPRTSFRDVLGVDVTERVWHSPRGRGVSSFGAKSRGMMCIDGYYFLIEKQNECDLIYHIWWAMYRWSEHLYRNILESSSSRFTALCFQACLLVEQLLDFRQRLVLGLRQAAEWGCLKNGIIFPPDNLGKCVICRRDIFSNQMTKRAADRRDAAWHIKRRG